MAPTAGYLAKIKRAATLAGAYTNVAGVEDVTVTRNGEKVETSAYADNDGYRRFMLGIKTIEISADSSYLVADTEQDAIRAAHTGGGTTFLQVLHDGTNGFKGEFVIDSFDIKPDLSGKVKFSFKASLTGGPTVV